MSDKNLGEEGGYGFTRPSATSNETEGRDYKCPKCGGEFDRWEKDVLNTGQSKPKCPFCGMEKGGYGGSL